MTFPPYGLLQTLGPGPHTDGITTISFSTSVTFLACGSDDGSVTVWEVTSGRLLQRIITNAAVLCLKWHPNERDTLLIGCEGGLLCVIEAFNPSIENDAYHVLTGIQADVYCLDIDVISNYLAIGVGSEVQVAKRVTERSGQDGHIVRLRSMQFLPGGRKMIVSYLNHGVVCWDIIEKQTLWRIKPDHEHGYIGSSAISPDFKHILIHNLSNGMDLYELGNSAVQQRYRVPVDMDANYPMAVGFTNNGQSVICGAQDGHVRVFNRVMGAHQQTLGHEDNLIQAICTIQTKHHAFMATATSLSNEPPSIKIWRATTTYQQSWQPFALHLKHKLTVVADYLEYRTPRFSSILNTLVFGFALASGILLIVHFLSKPVIMDELHILLQPTKVVLVKMIDWWIAAQQKVTLDFHLWWSQWRPLIRERLRRLVEEV